MYFCFHTLTVAYTGTDTKAIHGNILKDYCPICKWKVGAVLGVFVLLLTVPERGWCCASVI